ncbi:gamma-glutamylcyclotransferase family protein [Pinibacter soli]|uniref:Gamma-glutamylcyclotransferase n=1 Tax=Pinibacter soli TaxID=3044211 RepID=A0ABT6RKB0_9BACT|nr:gamma-glutamylcyclotransferase family protein [Pinibacter soli]MDI3322334.1 gamma-glutamylcyclotransferase [Pinibacter soli]
MTNPLATLFEFLLSALGFESDPSAVISSIDPKFNVTTYLFVYGTLRKSFPAHSTIEEYFSFVCNAQIRGELYYEGSFPAAVPTEKEKSIQGELYKLKNEDFFGEVFCRLDEYEEVQNELFVRERTTIFVDNNSIKTWIYWYNKSVENLEAIESGDLVEYYNNQKIK